MPRKEINYQNTVIYKIQHIEKEDLIYIGHTTDFTKRKCSHKHMCNNVNSKLYNSKVYTMIRDNGGWDMFKMLEVKKFPCNDRNEASSEEDIVMKEMKAIMNTINAIFDIKQFNEDNKDKLDQYKKKYREDHKDKIKQYREDHKDKMKQYTLHYYETNKDKIKQNYKEKVLCDCGCFINRTTRNSTRHQQSQQHQAKLKNK